MCTHKLDDGPLVCTRTTAHDEAARGGHTYAASDAPDRHVEVCDD
jgi:hypothetical protein